MKLARIVRQVWLGATSRSSQQYWERRYGAGMNSGAGSYGDLAAFKARVLNEFVRKHQVRSVIEFGCGDGNQLSLADYPKYLGLDVSRRAVDLCSQRFRDDASKSFLWYDPAHAWRIGNFLSADLVLSLDVVYHLIEDSVYRDHLRDLFSTSQRYVVIYSSDRDTGQPAAAHVRHRKFTADVARDFPEFRLIEKIANPYPDQTFADFHFFERTDGRAPA